MSHFNFSGKLYEAGSPIAGPDNRGLRYGDGLFETIRYTDGKPELLNEHFARLWRGLGLLQFELPKHFTPETLEQEIVKLLKKNGHNTARVRLSIFRGNGGLYDPENHLPLYTIQSWPLAGKAELNSNGLEICIYRDAKKSMDRFSNLKHNNYLPYSMAALFAKAQKCNDALVLNSNDHICDSTMANVFLIKDGSIFTPALSEGCVAGTFREFMLAHLRQQGHTVVETAIEEDFLFLANELFLTNAIQHIRWVKALGDKQYTQILTAQINASLPQTFL